MECNLGCGYCYIGKKKLSLSMDTAKDIIDFVFSKTPSHENIDIGFFGGEPLLELEILKNLTDLIERQPSYDANRLSLSVVTNGTLLTPAIFDFLSEHGIELCISCDGPPDVQNAYRRFRDGSKSSAIVQRNIQKAVSAFPSVLVNAVYTPTTVRHLCETVDYFSSLGVRRIFLSADYSATWSETDLETMREEYEKIGRLYIDYYMRQSPRFVSIIDNKISLMLRGGSGPTERCRMGSAEFAFTPDGNIYPCERLIGAGDGEDHCIGNVREGIKPEKMACNLKKDGDVNLECRECGIREYCMNWCGCSNYFSTGYYNRVSHFLCASEQAAVKVAFEVFKSLESCKEGVFVEHLSGRGFFNAFKT